MGVGVGVCTCVRLREGGEYGCQRRGRARVATGGALHLPGAVCAGPTQRHTAQPKSPLCAVANAHRWKGTLPLTRGMSRSNTNWRTWMADEPPPRPSGGGSLWRQRRVAAPIGVGWWCASYTPLAPTEHSPASRRPPSNPPVLPHLSSSASKSLGLMVPLPSSYSAHRSRNASRSSGHRSQSSCAP